MKHVCFKVSAVLVARGHNPTILHPSFLKHEGIVPKDWEPSKDPICTPPFAAVSFTSGFSFVVEQEKLQVEFNGENADQQADNAAEMARKYAEKLPHVSYAAVGINFTAFCPLADPAGFIIRQFIKEGPWNSEELPLSSARQNFTYRFHDHQLNITLEAGHKQIDEPREEKSGVIIHANYHSKCSTKDRLASVRTLLQQVEDRKEHFKNTAGLFLGEG